MLRSNPADKYRLLPESNNSAVAEVKKIPFENDPKQFEKEITRLLFLVYSSPAEHKEEQEKLRSLLVNNVSNAKLNKKYIQENLIRFLFTEALINPNCKQQNLQKLKALAEDKNNDLLIRNQASFFYFCINNKKIYDDLAARAVKQSSLIQSLVVFALCHPDAPLELRDKVVNSIIMDNVEEVGSLKDLSTQKKKAILDPLGALAINENNLYAIKQLRSVYRNSKKENHTGRGYLFLAMEAMIDKEAFKTNRKIFLDVRCGMSLFISGWERSITTMYLGATVSIADNIPLDQPLQYVLEFMARDTKKSEYESRFKETLSSLGITLSETAKLTLSN